MTEESWRQHHILRDKLFSDEHREQLWLIFAQKFSDRPFTRTGCAFNTQPGGSNCYGRVLRIAIARCESELVGPIVPACVVNIQVEDLCYEAKI